MKLYHAPASPFVRKVMVLAQEIGVALDLVPVSGHPMAPGTMPVDLNPLGKIPALITDAGEVLYDSRVICRYLDDLTGAGLYSRGAALWPILRAEALADGVMDAAVLMAYEVRLRPEELRHAPWIEGQWAKIARALDVVEAAPPSGGLDLGQIALGCALGYLDFRHGARDWRKGRPQLADWAERFGQRPSMQATLPA